MIGTFDSNQTWAMAKCLGQCQYQLFDSHCQCQWQWQCQLFYLPFSQWQFQCHFFQPFLSIAMAISIFYHSRVNGNVNDNFFRLAYQWQFQCQFSWKLLTMAMTISMFNKASRQCQWQFQFFCRWIVNGNGNINCF